VNTNAEINLFIKDKILPAIHDGFLKLYPDTFIKCRTKDHKIYTEANGCMYNWYMLIINAVQSLNFSPEYYQTNDEACNNDNSHIFRFYNDLIQSDFLYFIIKNVDIRHV